MQTRQSGFMSTMVGVDCRDWVVALWTDQAWARAAQGGPILYSGPIADLPADVLSELVERGFVVEV